MAAVKLPAKDDYMFTIEFADGRKPHSVDPMEVSLKLEASGAVGAIAGLKAFREAVGLPSLTETESSIVLNAFNEFNEALKKKLGITPTSPPSTATPPSAEIQKTPAPSATASGSTDCGCGR